MDDFRDTTNSSDGEGELAGSKATVLRRIADTHSAGPFATSGSSATFVPPGIVVEDVGQVRLPLSLHDALKKGGVGPAQGVILTAMGCVQYADFVTWDGTASERTQSCQKSISLRSCDGKGLPKVEEIRAIAPKAPEAPEAPDASSGVV